MQADSELHHALRNGMDANDTVLTRVDAMNASGIYRWVEWGTLLGGSVAVATAVLVGVFGRGETEVHASVAVTRDGGTVTFVGRF